ncbi:MAG: hypothetical protein R3E39_25285 [Anaerolineae bacterium]
MDSYFVYISSVDKEIWAMNLDGSSPRQLTHDGKGQTTYQTLLAASPDGHYLAYFTDSWYIVKEGRQVQKLALLDLTTGEQSLLTNQDSTGNVVWSPDSQQLAYARYDVPTVPDYCYRWKAYVIPFEGGPSREIGHGQCSSAELRWSPDGSTILYTSKEAGGDYPQLYAMNPDGTKIRRLTDTKSGCFICYFPQWTPDGQSIVFYNHPDLYSMRSDGSDLRKLTDFQEIYNVIDVAHARYNQPDMIVTADSQTLVYVMGNPLQIVRMTLQPGGWERRTLISDITRNPQIYSHALCCLSPDESTLYYLGSVQGGDGLYALNMDLGEPYLVAAGIEQPLMVKGQG